MILFMGSELTPLGEPAPHPLHQSRLRHGQFLSADLAGVRCDFDLVMVVELRDGMIIRFTEYFDTAKLA